MSVGIAVAHGSGLACSVTRRTLRDHEGFTLLEMLLVLGIITIIAAIAIPGLMRAKASGNEAAAIGSMRTIISAEAAFAATCGAGGYATDLEDLGLAPIGGGPAFLSSDLVAASPGGTPKSGYEFTISGGTGNVVLVADDTCNGAANDAETEFFAIADPVTTTTGARFFGADHNGQIRQDSEQLADMTAGFPLAR